MSARERGARDSGADRPAHQYRPAAGGSPGTKGQDRPHRIDGGRRRGWQLDAGGGIQYLCGPGSGRYGLQVGHPNYHVWPRCDPRGAGDG